MAPRLRRITRCEGCFDLTKRYYDVMSSFTNIHVTDIHICNIIYIYNVHDILVFCDIIFCTVQLKRYFKTIKAEHSHFTVQNNKFYAFKMKVRLCNDRS